MGWASGSGLLSAIIEVIQENVTDPQERFEVYKELIPIFEDHDCDTMDECVTIDDLFDKAYDLWAETSADNDYED